MFPVVKARAALAEEPGSIPITHEAAQQSVTPVTRDETRSSCLHRQHTQCADFHAGKIPIHIKTKESPKPT